MEEKKDVICWASLLDIEVSTEFSVYFSNSHVYDDLVLRRPFKSWTNFAWATICLHFYSLILLWEQINKLQNKNIRQQNDLIWSWTWQNIKSTELTTTLTSNLPQALVLTSQIVSTVRFELSCSETEKDGLSVYVRGSCFVSNFRPFSTEAFNFWMWREAMLWFE